MKLDSRKNRRRDKMMRSKSIDMQEVRDRPEECRRVERLFHVMDGNNRCFPDGRKGMRSPGEIENVKKKIHARARKVLCHEIGNFVWASGSRKKFSVGEG